MVPSKHLKRCDKIPNIFSTVFRHLDCLQLKILVAFDNFLCEYQPDLLSKCIISNYMYVIMNRLLTIGQWLRTWKISFILLKYFVQTSSLNTPASEQLPLAKKLQLQYTYTFNLSQLQSLTLLKMSLYSYSINYHCLEVPVSEHACHQRRLHNGKCGNSIYQQNLASLVSILPGLQGILSILGDIHHILPDILRALSCI